MPRLVTHRTPAHIHEMARDLVRDPGIDLTSEPGKGISMQGSITKVTGRELLTVVVLTLLIGLILPLPAGADQPAEVVVPVTLEDDNPCEPGSTHEVTIVFNAAIHTHNNNQVIIVNSDVSTDDGFVGRGHETQVTSESAFRTNINFMYSNAETGQKFWSKGRVVVDLTTGETLVSDFRSKCIRG